MAQAPAGASCPSEQLKSGIVVDSGISNELGDTALADLFVLRGIFAATEDIAPESFAGTSLTTATKALTDSELGKMLVGMPYITSDHVFPHGFQDVDDRTGESFWRTPPAVGMLKSFYKTKDGSYGIEWYGTVKDALRFAGEDVVHLSMANKSMVNEETGEVVRQMLHVAVLPKGEPPAWPGSRITHAYPLMPKYNTHMEEFRRLQLRKQIRTSASIIGRRAPATGGGREGGRVEQRDAMATAKERFRASIAAGSVAIAARNRAPASSWAKSSGSGGRGARSARSARTLAAGTRGVILSLRSHTAAPPAGHPLAMSAPPAQNTPSGIPAQQPAPDHQPAEVPQQPAAPQQAQQQPPAAAQQQQPAQDGASQYIPFTEPLSTVQECESALKHVQDIMAQTLPHVAIEGATEEQSAAEKALSPDDAQMLVNLRFRYETAKNTLDCLRGREQAGQQPAPAQQKQQQEQHTPTQSQPEAQDTDVTMREAVEVSRTVAQTFFNTLANMIHHTDRDEEDVAQSDDLVNHFQKLISARSLIDYSKHVTSLMEARVRWNNSRVLGPAKIIEKQRAANPTGDAAARQATFASMNNIGLQMRQRGRPSTRASMPAQKHVPQRTPAAQQQQSSGSSLANTDFGRAMAMMGYTIEQQP